MKAAGLECLLMLFLVLSDVKPLVLDEEVDNHVDPVGHAGSCVTLQKRQYP